MLAGSSSWSSDRDQPPSLITFHKPSGLECGQRTEAGGNTDAGDQRNVSDAGSRPQQQGLYLFARGRSLELVDADVDLISISHSECGSSD